MHFEEDDLKGADDEFPATLVDDEVDPLLDDDIPLVEDDEILPEEPEEDELDI